MSFNRIEVFDEKDDEFSLMPYSYPKNHVDYSMKELITQGDKIVNLSCCVYRSAPIKKLPDNFFELNFADWDLGIWMAQFGRVSYLEQSTSVYRVNNKGQWTSMNGESKKETVMNTLDDMDAFFEFKYKRWFDKGRYMVENDIEPLPYMTWKTKIKRLLHIVK